jgi:DNA-binding NtrC family response regulator
LDEIGDLPGQTQVKLLRVLQERIINRVGGNEPISIDVRIISATHQNLEFLIEQGRFREDLYYRLNAAVVELPPLRDRTEDIPLLLHHLLARLAREFGMEKPTVDREAVKLLQRHDWPGNVRQLENVVRRALVISRGYTISEETLQACLRSPSTLGRGASNPAASGLTDAVRQRLRQARDGRISGALGPLVEDLERELYEQAVALAHGNQTMIADWLGVSRLTVREKLDKYQLFPKRRSGSP